MQSYSSCHHSHLVIFALVHHLEKEELLSCGYWFVPLCFCVFSSSFFTVLPALYTQRKPHLCLSNMEVLITVIEDGTVLTAGSDVANTLDEGEI